MAAPDALEGGQPRLLLRPLGLPASTTSSRSSTPTTVPRRTYLREIVRAFADPRVGYVAAPSVCDANAGESWAARGRLYKEATFHGPQQAGGHHAIPPTCIGSHYAVRTQALQEIGGVGPELAEDFSTSLMMNAFGWSGVFALDAEAHGDGPDTFADFITQEFQWARSLSNVHARASRAATGGAWGSASGSSSASARSGIRSTRCTCWSHRSSRCGRSRSAARGRASGWSTSSRTCSSCRPCCWRRSHGSAARAGCGRSTRRC